MPENVSPTDALRSPGQAAQVIVWAADTLPAEPQVDERLEYRGANGATGFCRLRVYPHLYNSGARIVVLSDQPGNADNLSITNAIEEIATQVVNRFRWDPQMTIFVQHYPPGVDAYPARVETFDRVRLRWADASGQPYAMSPVWTTLYAVFAEHGKDGGEHGANAPSDMAIRHSLRLPYTV